MYRSPRLLSCSTQKRFRGRSASETLIHCEKFKSVRLRQSAIFFTNSSPGSQDRTRGRRRYWWTGEDSNLRSPQGAADLQSAGFSHSPTRPAEPFGTQLHPVSKTRNLKRTTVRGTSQCRKGSCQKTPALALLSRGVSSATLLNFPVRQSQLAEGVEPPTL